MTELAYRVTRAQLVALGACEEGLKDFDQYTSSSVRAATPEECKAIADRFAKYSAWAVGLIVSGDGDGSGDGYGYGSGDGYGYGSGYGDGSGSGHGDGYGSGSGYGSGFGDGSGSGDGYGYGDGYGPGDGSGEEVTT